MNTQVTIVIGLCLVVLGFFVLYTKPATPPYGSTQQGQEYISTSTAPNTLYGATITASQKLSSVSGSFGSWVITGANTGVVNFYDATTSNVSLRTGQRATSTILLASFPASTVAGTYVIDATLSQGLYIDLVSGVMPTSTVTFR